MDYAIEMFWIIFYLTFIFVKLEMNNFLFYQKK